jgi:hypothetical protein
MAQSYWVLTGQDFLVLATGNTQLLLPYKLNNHKKLQEKKSVKSILGASFIIQRLKMKDTKPFFVSLTKYNLIYPWMSFDLLYKRTYNKKLTDFGLYGKISNLSVAVLIWLSLGQYIKTSV